ncbi:RAD51-associated protein 1-like isoform X1 [Heptranchias perlo]|uniref:RAD51-associated protein 1-like isoform X1 n=1 Tax=Heptranchias perlo TaxID=212740 RepID=UPI00355A1708
MARPVRTKKVVDYSQFGDFDDDEDFAHVSAPPSKKSRLTINDQKQKREKIINVSDSQDAKAKKEPPKERLPLDEKLYQRNLEAALILSVQEPTSEANESAREATNTNTSLHSNCSVDSDFLGLDKITAENEGPSVRRRQSQAVSGATSKQRQILLDDRGSDDECEEDYGKEQDYTPSEESESDGSVSNADEDEEFTFKRLSNKNKKRNAIKIQTKKKEKNSPKPNSSATVPVKSKPLLLEAMPASPPSSTSFQASSPSTGMRKPKWTPPASKESSNNSWEGVSIRSPCQGLRLGLSRLARVKPLHPSTDND